MPMTFSRRILFDQISEVLLPLVHDVANNHSNLTFLSSLRSLGLCENEKMAKLKRLFCNE